MKLPRLPALLTRNADGTPLLGEPWAAPAFVLLGIVLLLCGVFG